MVTLLKNNSSQGVYILEDQGGWVAANTPGEADLDSLVLGSTYIYFDSVLRFQHYQTHNREGDTNLGWNVMPTGEGTQDWSTHGTDKEYISLMVEEDCTTSEKLHFLGKYRNRTTRQATKIYFVKQKTATTFYQFSNATPAQKNYCSCIIRGIDSVETGNSDKQTITIALEVVWA